MPIHPIEHILGYDFTDKSLLYQAITHPSASHQHYQRLEFLGDRVVGLIIADWLMHNHDLAEGSMARCLSELTSTTHLSAVGRHLKILPHIRSHLSKEHLRLATENLLADTMEALVAAVFTDSSYQRVYTLFIPYLIDATMWTPPMQNAKNALQEWTQKNHGLLPQYIVLSHDEQGFSIQCSVPGYPPAYGKALQKKSAEFQAAAIMLSSIVQISVP